MTYQNALEFHEKLIFSMSEVVQLCSTQLQWVLVTHAHVQFCPSTGPAGYCYVFKVGPEVCPYFM